MTSNIYTVKHLRLKKKPLAREKKLSVELLLEGKDGETISSNHPLLLNFNGPLNISAIGENGTAGANGKDKNNALVFRDGGDGERGENGGNGQPGDNLFIHVWKEKDSLFLNVQNLTKNITWKYQTSLNSPVTINVTGGDGGIGGNGGDGGDGKDGVITSDKNKLPGDGGDGANGGNGGNGGNSGNIQIVFHDNAASYQSQFNYILNPGIAGNGGTGGKAGKAGTPEAGQDAALNGANGTAGMNGMNGTGNNLPIISVANFDLNQFN